MTDQREVSQFDQRFHPWPGWPNNEPWCTRCTFQPSDDYERLAEKLVEGMHTYGTSFRSEPHQVGEAYNNLVRFAAHALREVGRKGIRRSLKDYGKRKRRLTRN